MRDYLVTKIELEGKELLMAAFFEDLRLQDLCVENPANASHVGGVYLGSLDSLSRPTGGAFVNLGEAGHCFIKSFDRKKTDGGRVLAQVTKDAAGNKQAAASQDIRIAGRYAVVSAPSWTVAPASVQGSAKADEPAASKGLPEGKIPTASNLSVSSRLPASMKRKLKERFGSALAFSDCAVLLRTEAALADPSLVLLEAKRLRRQLLQVCDRAKAVPAGTCLLAPEAFFMRFLGRLPEKPERFLTDLPFAEKPLREAAARYGAAFAEKKPGTLPYAELYGLYTELDRLLGRCVHIKSGGELIIQPTEAFVSVDVNSAHFSGAGERSRSIRKINEDAVRELFRQIRLRALSGIILADLINMDSADDRDAVLDLARDLAGKERVQTEAVDITPLGILEILREKSGPCLFQIVKG